MTTKNKRQRTRLLLFALVLTLLASIAWASDWIVLRPQGTRPYVTFANVAQFYASGPHTFFDIAPLKYSSWDEYQKGVREVLADFKSARFTVSDDAELHAAGKYVWGTATVKEEMTHKNDKVDTGAFRWTMVFEKQGGKWLIVHEHVSAPAQ